MKNKKVMTKRNLLFSPPSYIPTFVFIFKVMQHTNFKNAARGLTQPNVRDSLYIVYLNSTDWATTALSAFDRVRLNQSEYTQVKTWPISQN